MFLNVVLLVCLWASYPEVYSAEQDEHRDFQYNSVVDSQSGRYNFAYDTGNDNDIAHSLHMQYRDANGIVRGRYGYTDPRGKLRMVEYEAGPDGFKARGDVGPDQFPHDQAPDLGPAAPQSYSAAYRRAAGEDLDLVPRPVQMAGWDPLNDPMGSQPRNGASYSEGYPEGYPESERFVGYPASEEQSGYSTTNITDGDETANYAPEAQSYDGRYPRIEFSSSEVEGNNEEQSADSQKQGNERQSENINEVPLNVNNIDVDPDEIREAASSGPVRRSADGDRVQSYSNQPYSYRNYLRQTHDHDAEVSQASGTYRGRQTHDHDAEVTNRATHDHAAELRRHRINHDHAAERYRAGQTHNHEAQNWHRGHDHDAERDYYYRRYYPDRYYPRRIFYKDSHSQVPHEHNSPVYHNGHYHHLDSNGRYQTYSYPATARPRQLKYVPANRYHDKYYYWTD